MKVTGFVQKATGTFETYLRPNTAHCGPQVSMLPIKGTFRYNIELTYHPEALDDRGFLIDNTFFRDYFEGFRGSQVSVSCEVLAKTIAEQMCRELGNRACTCDAVVVELFPFEGVSVTCKVTPAVSSPNRGLPTPGGLWLGDMAEVG